MNNRNYVFILVLNIFISDVASAGLGNRGLAHRHKYPKKHWTPKLKALRQSDEENVQDKRRYAENLQSDSSNENLSDLSDSENSDGRDLGSPEDAEDVLGFDEAVSEIPKRNPKQFHLKRNTKKLAKVLLNEVKPTDDLEDDGEQENGEDYVHQFSYDPNIPFSKERSKRLISSKDGDNGLNKDTEAEERDLSEEELYKDLELEASLDVTTKLENLNVLRRAGEKESTSAIEKAVTPIGLLSDAHAPTPSIESGTDAANDLSRLVRTSGVISAPKAASIPSKTTTTSGGSQGLRNLVELNKAYKLLLCASNKFVKLANKTVMDRMVEECATATAPKPSTTTDSGRTTADIAGADCCLKGNSLVGATRKAADGEEDQDDAGVEELLEVTTKPKRKQGRKPSKELLSWIQSRGSEAYDSLPRIRLLPGQGDPSVYFYRDYDGEAGEDYEEATEKSTAPDKLKTGTRTRGSSSPQGHLHKPTASSLTKEIAKRKQSLSKTVLLTRLTPSPLSSPPTTSLSVSSDPDAASEEATESSVRASSQVIGKGKKTTPRYHVQRQFRRMKYNKKFVPIAYFQSPGPGAEEAALHEVY